MTADLLDVVRQSVKLTRRGKRWVGLCPFHGDKRPSFAVWEHRGRQFWGCFGCGTKGDVVGFVMRDRGLTYPEALRALNGGTIPAVDAATRAARLAEQRREAYRHRILAAFQDRHPAAATEEIAFLAELDDGRLVAWAGRP